MVSATNFFIVHVLLGLDAILANAFLFLARSCKRFGSSLKRAVKLFLNGLADWRLGSARFRLELRKLV